MDERIAFIKGHEWYFDELFEERKATGENSKGNPLRMNLCPLGINTVKLTEVKLKKNREVLFVHLTFQPDACVISGTKQKIAPIVSTVFEDSLNAVGILYNHVFPPRPAKMERLEYLQHVCRRFQTWINVPIEVGIQYKKFLIRDAYGVLETHKFGGLEALYPTFYPMIVPKESFNWDTALVVTEKDCKDYEAWWETYHNRTLKFDLKP